jgi:hypothetical protein
LGNNTREQWGYIDEKAIFKNLKEYTGEIDEAVFAKDSKEEILKWLVCDPEDIGETIKQSIGAISAKYYKNYHKEDPALLSEDWVNAMFKAMLISSKNQLSGDELGKLISLKDQFVFPLTTNEKRLSLEIDNFYEEALEKEGRRTTELWSLAKKQLAKNEKNPNDVHVCELIDVISFSRASAEEIRKWLNNPAKHPGVLISNSVRELVKIYETESFIGGEKTNDFVLAMLLSSIPHLTPQELAKLNHCSAAWLDRALSLTDVEIKAMDGDEKELYFIEAIYIERLCQQIKIADRLGSGTVS